MSQDSAAVQPTPEAARDLVAQAAYTAYGNAAGWKTWDDQAMPTWEELPPHVKDRWEAAAVAAMTVGIASVAAAVQGAVDTMTAAADAMRREAGPG